MFKEAISDLVSTIKTIPALADSTARGEVGKVNTFKNAGCLVMPDFESAENFSQEPGELSKQIPFLATCFIIAAHRKTLFECEDAAMDLAESVMKIIAETEFSISMDGNQKFFHWEVYSPEWIERSASLTVLSIDFKIKLQV